MPNREKALKQIEWATEDGGHVAIAVWCREDVDSIAPGLTPEQQDEVLDLVDAKQDAKEGINWTVLADYAESYVREHNLDVEVSDYPLDEEAEDATV